MKHFCFLLVFLSMFIFTGAKDPNDYEGCICSPWKYSDFSQCSKPCGGGLRSRSKTRMCAEAALVDDSGNFHICLTDSTDVEFCNKLPCGCKGQCTEWSEWLSNGCSTNCGTGKETVVRKRTCEGRTGGNSCPQREEKIQTCTNTKCPDCICGSWSKWSRYSHCSRSCGHGIQSRDRTRKCTAVVPSQSCQPASVEQKTITCVLGTCCEDPVTCSQWSQWAASTCSTTCGIGRKTLTRKRSCAFGAQCNEHQERTEQCRLKVCEATCDAMCGPWKPSRDGICSKTCDGGVLVRTSMRSCPSFLSDCQKTRKKEVTCNTITCPSTCDILCGKWNTLTEGACSKTCDGGVLVRKLSRSCPNFVPECKRTRDETAPCNHITCPATCDILCGKWKTLTEGACSKTCDGGVLVRKLSRSCPNFVPECKRTRDEKTTCNHKTCPATCDVLCGKWNTPTDGSCSKTCNGGVLVRTSSRSCPIHVPECKTTRSKNVACNTKTCPSTCDRMCGQWQSLSDGVCSKTCDSGVLVRTSSRNCPSIFSDCKQTRHEEVACNKNTCPETCDKLCSTWITTKTTLCSASCDGGSLTVLQKRTCPPTVTECSINRNVRRQCNTQRCQKSCDELCSAWRDGSNSPCSVTCGDGTQAKSQTRTCPLTASHCSTSKHYHDKCNIAPCIVGNIISSAIVCKYNGQYIPHPTKCNKFYQCSWTVPHLFTCHSGLVFNSKISVCDWPANVDCGSKTS